MLHYNQEAYLLSFYRIQQQKVQFAASRNSSQRKDSTDLAKNLAKSEIYTELYITSRY